MVMIIVYSVKMPVIIQYYDTHIIQFAMRYVDGVWINRCSSRRGQYCSIITIVNTTKLYPSQDNR